MSDTATAPAPDEAAGAPAVEQAPRGAPSTRGAPRTAQDGPAPPLNRQSAQDILRQAYGRQKEMQEGAVDDGGREAAPGPAKPERQAPAAPQRPARAVPERETGRASNGRFLPRQQAAAAPPAVDAPPDEGVEQTPTQATPRPAPPAKAPAAKPPAEPGSPPPESPPSPAPEADTADAPPTAPQAEQGLPEEFKSARWLRAFQAEPGLRRTVGRIRADPNLSASRKAEALAEKLSEGLQAADASEWRAQQMRQLREENPQAFIQQLRADEAEAEASEQLAQRITQMIAEAYEVDPADPDFLEAGPREGDDRVEGLKRFVEFTAKKSPVFQTALRDALQAQAQAHEKALADLKAQHKLDVEAAVERGRGQARSPYGRNGAPPRSTGTGVVPVGQDGGPGGGPRPGMARGIADVRGLIGLGYQQREPAE